MRLLAYEVLTQLIVWLGALRQRLMERQWWQPRHDRIFDLYEFDRWSCCDCGLQHAAEYFGPDHDCGHRPLHGLRIVGHCWPVRPKSYHYRLRTGAAKPDLAVTDA